MSDGTTGRPGSAGWFTSSHSNEVNACVQVRFVGDTVQIADSKDRGHGSVITVPGPEWDAFVAAVLGGSTTSGDLRAAPAPDGGYTITGPGGTALCYTAAEWAAFRAGAADGEFRRPSTEQRPVPA